MSDDPVLPNDDGFWPAMEWSEAEWHGFLTPELTDRVRGYAAERGVPFQAAVVSLLEGTLDQTARHTSGPGPVGETCDSTLDTVMTP
jgi:hypothetical protein